MAEKRSTWASAAAPVGDSLLEHGSKALVHGTGEALATGARAAKGLAEPVVSPTAKRMGDAVGRTLSRPIVAGSLLAVGAGAPFAADAFNKRQQPHEDTMTNMRRDTSRVITAADVSVDAFLTKKAAAGGGGYGSPFAEGLGKGIATDLSRSLFSLGGRAMRGIGNIFQDPARKRVFDQVVQQDPVIHDAMSKNPDTKAVIDEAYATMTRFAPNLALDLNAVRSFLREAVVMGGGVNYATIKNLVDTERAITEASRGD